MSYPPGQDDFFCLVYVYGIVASIVGAALLAIIHALAPGSGHRGCKPGGPIRPPAGISAIPRKTRNPGDSCKNLR